MVVAAGFAAFRSGGAALSIAAGELSAELAAVSAAAVPAGGEGLAKLDLSSLTGRDKVSPAGAFILDFTVHKKHFQRLDFGEVGKFHAVKAADGAVALSRDEIAAPEGSRLSAVASLLGSRLEGVPPPLGAGDEGVTILYIHEVLSVL